MAESGGSVSTLALTTGFAPILPAALGQSFTVGLANCLAGRRYAVNCHYQATVITATVCDINSRLELRRNGGAWQTLRSNTSSWASNGQGTYLQAIDQPMALGSALLVPVVDGDTIEVRAVAAANAVDHATVENGGDNGSFWISLKELL
jgi:hypothetical protein